MASHTKMIVITSDEDVIRKLSLNKTINTQIIELDDDNEMALMPKNDHNIINLAFLAELSELNSKSEQIYKRALDSPLHNCSKQVKLSKKSADLICAICGGEAYGFNYDVLSCPSCKAFFRRNANQPPGNIRCLTGQGECLVAHEIRRKCPRCRLDRCFAVGMRKDFIVSEQEKQQRKKLLEENRNISLKRLAKSESTKPALSQPLVNSESLSVTLDEIDRLLMDMDEKDDNSLLDEIDVFNEMEDLSLETLSFEDLATIESVRSIFLPLFQSETCLCSSVGLSDHATALISWSQMANQLSLQWINCFRQIDEFESLDADDRFILIKFNLLSVSPVLKCFSYKFMNRCCSHHNNEQAEKNCQFFPLCGHSDGIQETFINLVLSLVEITEEDATILSVLVTVLIFAQGLSMNEDEPPLKNALAVYRAQSHYTRILWNYFVHKYGEIQACKHFTQLLTIIFRIQSASKSIREFFRAQFLTSNIGDTVAPLVQSVLHIS